MKLNADGTIEQFKARVVAKGYNQLKGIDYNESFSLVAKIVTGRIFFFITAENGWPLYQKDINNMFLLGFLDEEIYMSPPEGYFKEKEG